MRCLSQLTFEELRRGEKRRGFLSKITLAGKTSGLQFMEALKAATAVLQQDGSEFGSGKQCSIALSLLEPSSSTSEPRPCLQFKAASSDCQDCVVGCKLLHSYKQVSLTVLVIDGASLASYPLYLCLIKSG